MKRRDLSKLRRKEAPRPQEAPRPANPPVSAGPALADKLLFRAELAVGALLTLFVVVEHVVVLTHAGPLWRDEVHFVNLSNVPTLSEWWQLNEHDTFPVVWQGAVRMWTASGLGRSDFGLRFLGFLVGLGIVALLWWNTWRFGRNVPLVCLVLVGLSPTVLRYGDSLRGYGWGTLTLLWMLAAVWEMVREPNRRTVLLGLAASLLAVHSMYFNAVLLLALGISGAAVSLCRGSWKPVLAVGGVGLLAALSMLPYFDPISRQYKWNAIVKFTVGLPQLLGKFVDALTTYGDFMIYVWGALLVLVLVACGYSFARTVRGPRAGWNVAAVFVGVGLIAGLACYFGFVLSSRLVTWRWYYVGLISFLGVLLDHGLGLLVQKAWIGRVVRMAVVFAIAAVIAPRVWAETQARMSNVDLIAAKLEAVADEHDMILVSPWWPGVTFARYYHGKTPWTTLPELGDLRVHRFDIFREKMSEPEPIRPVLEKIASTLRSGHRLWIIGGLDFLKPGAKPFYVPPLPNGPLSEGAYLAMWSQQAAFFLQNHATKLDLVLAPSPPSEVVSFEDFPLLVVEGWR